MRLRDSQKKLQRAFGTDHVRFCDADIHLEHKDRKLKAHLCLDPSQTAVTFYLKKYIGFTIY